MANRLTVGVIGSEREISTEQASLAFEVGMYIAERNAILICGGLGGVMEAAAKGASEHGGLVVGILPSLSKSNSNQYVTVAIPTGLGIARNTMIVHSSDVIIAFPGAFGTLSEIAMALETGKSVVYLPGTWNLKIAGSLENARFIEAFDAKQAVGLALGEIGRKKA